MLKKAFHDHNKKPVILVNHECDDPARGDARGRKGLAEAMGRSHGVDVLYADRNVLDVFYPDLSLQSYHVKLGRFLKDKNAKPVMVMGYNCDLALLEAGVTPSSVPYCSDINDDLAIDYLGEGELVAHNLTADRLHEAARLFDVQHPELSGVTIISVMTAFQRSGYGYENECDVFSEHMASMLAGVERGAIYICGTRRNDPSKQAELQEALVRHLSQSGLYNVDVLNWSFTHDGFNPYLGLLTRAEHTILWGDSRSILSEALFAGKSVHSFSCSQSPQLEQAGFVWSFLQCDQFATKDIIAPNITQQLADKLWDAYSPDL